MKICVCDVCKASEDASQGGLFNLRTEQLEIDICGACAANVVATMLGSHAKETLEAIKAGTEPLTPRKEPLREVGKRIDEASKQKVAAFDDDLERFMAQHSNGTLATTPEDMERSRIEALSADVGAQVFVQEFGQEVRIGSTQKIGMPGRKVNRRVEVVEAVSGKPGCYYCFQVKE